MFDAAIVGSGFGGAVTACRLAEAGYRVIVLERGRRWDRASYPRTPADPWFFRAERPETHNGWMEVRAFRHMAVVQGAAVGGGSLVYANVSAIPPPATFDRGWPAEITWAELAPLYARVGAMMDVRPVPPGQWPPRTHLVREAAAAIGEAARFRPLDLAIAFKEDWDGTEADTRRFTNAFGVEQGTCIHCGDCDIGCPVDARNTLDRNYLAQAERHGAEIRPLHLVTAVTPAAGGYDIDLDRLQGGARVPDRIRARLVVVAAGSLNSTELLLKCRDVAATLPGLSPALGRNWSSNGDFLTPTWHAGRTPDPSNGPTITAAIDFLDGSQGPAFWVQDGGWPDLLADVLQRAATWEPRLRAVLEAGRAALRAHGPLDRVMPWFAQGVDAANGRLTLRRALVPSGAWELDLDWDVAQSRPVIEAIVAMHRRLAAATGGTALVPPSWSLFHYLVTPHPLGGCNMGATAAEGVVDHRGEAFGYRNLYVIDGATVPEALGVNPSRTIAALAERAAGLIVAEGR